LYNPGRVLLHLQVKLQTPTPLSEGQYKGQYSEGPGVLKTLYDIIQLQAQSQAIKQLLQNRQQGLQGLLSPTNQALNQLVKGCQIAMHNAVLLASENQELKAANQRQKKRREKPCSYIAEGGVLTVEEGIRQAEDKRKETEEALSKPRAVRHCSICRSTEHTARTCLQK
jgi:hypothetical protein